MKKEELVWRDGDKNWEEHEHTGLLRGTWRGCGDWR